MTKPRKPGSVMPLSGGDYIDEGDGPKPFKPEEKPAKPAVEKPAKPATPRAR